MTNLHLFILVQFFIIKHFFVDFPLQTPYQYLNKGNLKHLGGYIHAGLHGAVSFIWLSAFTYSITNNFSIITLVFLLCVFESISHYIIDYAKIHINKRCKWGPTTHDQFWILLGVDQLLHFEIYFLMILIIEINI